jgi:cytochrome c oxidase accessory protein FixG
VLLALSFVFALLALTAWRGRLWCGWACPQTVFLEGVYRPIERWLEGPRERRLRAMKEPWTASRVARRAAKLVLFLVVSVAIAHTATAIFVSPRALVAMVEEGPAAHPEAFLLTLGFTLVLFVNFAWFREQFCVVVCPYGRLQSVLHDPDSVTVAYDERRGEPRGRKSRAAEADAPELGDCIDCHRCVVVCPTAIDIRNGMQMECLACLQCVDACDEVMSRIHRPRGLIGLYSQRQLAGGATRILRPRLAVYVALFLVSATTLVASLATRTDFEANVLRPRGANPFVVDGDEVRNSLEIHLVNKSPNVAEFQVAIDSPVEAEIVIGTPVVRLESLSDARVPISISIERKYLDRAIELELRVDDVTHGERRTTPIRFLAPFGSAGTPDSRHD